MNYPHPTSKIMRFFFGHREIFLFLITGILWGCNPRIDNQLNEGQWRGVFLLGEKQIPFNFSVKQDPSLLVTLINAEERFDLDEPYFEGDSLVLPINIFDSYLIGKASGDSFKGYWRKYDDKTSGMPFISENFQHFRFDDREKARNPSWDVSGKWSVIFENSGEENLTVGLFEQVDNEITGSILTTTGDYRYFQGTFNGDDFKLSAFSGTSPRLLEGEFIDEDNFKGTLSSSNGTTKFKAVRDISVELANPYSLTYLKDGFDRLDFSFPDLSGDFVSLSDEKYKGKVVVVTLMGSWCPNCMDEAAFLAPWYKENQDRGVEVIALSFEKKDDLSFAKTRLEKFKDRLGVEYEVLFAGLADKKVAGDKLPALNAVLSFPTTIIIDKTGKIRKIHTGFNGPATGKYYEDFVSDFKTVIDQLLSESEGGV